MEYENILSKCDCDYAELRTEKRTDISTRITNDEIKQISGTSFGMSARVLKDGSWGFAATNCNVDCRTHSAEIVKELIARAIRLAKLTKGKIKIKHQAVSTKTIKENINVLDATSQIESIKEIMKQIKYEKIISKAANCIDSRIEKEFYSSFGSDIKQNIGYTYLSYQVIAKEGYNLQRASEKCSSRTGFGNLKIGDLVERLETKIKRLLRAGLTPKGKFTVVLDPEMTGVLAHEALGHASEADSIIDRESILADKREKKIANDLVTIVDDPSAKNFGGYHYDDEGVEGKRTIIIESGVLKNYLTSRETSTALGINLNGHARADGYNSTPIIRMSNTYFERGKSKKQDVFDIKNGIYLKGMKGGSVDIFSGGFMFKAEEAYHIRNGELGQNFRDTTITGNVLQTLIDVECVGNDFGTSPGICGKFGQEAPVSDGGPHIRIKNVAIG